MSYPDPAAGKSASEIMGLIAENKRLRDSLETIADAESGWRFKLDPLEHARSVIEEMRDFARRALAETTPTEEEHED